MSLVTNFVKAVDGLWYEEVVIKGVFGNKKWMLVFDDDDPPELVIEGELDKKNQKAFAIKLIEHLKKEDLELGLRSSGKDSGRRFFGKDFRKSTPAYSFFVTVGKRIPNKFIDGRKKGVVDTHKEGVYLDPEC